MFSRGNELALEDFGKQLYDKGLPLGFINSKSFNEGYPADNPYVQQYLSFVKNRVAIDTGVPVDVLLSKEQKLVSDLAFSSFLLQHTACYIVTSDKVENKGFLSNMKIDVKIATICPEIIEIFKESAGVTQRVSNSVDKLLDTHNTMLANGELVAPVITWSKVPSIKAPRNFTSLIDHEYMILPVSVLNGYVRRMRETLGENLLLVKARKMGGHMRTFSVYADGKEVNKLYNDMELSEMFESVRSKPNTVQIKGIEFDMLEYFETGNMLFYEVGIPLEDYPKRQLNLLRINEIKKLETPEEIAEHIRYVRKYIDINFDMFMNDVQDMLSDKGLDACNTFLTRVMSNIKGEESKPFVCKSLLDFRITFQKCIDYYTTTFMTAVVDYVYANQLEFNGYTGRVVNSKVIESLGGSSELAEVKEEFDLDSLSF